MLVEKYIKALPDNEKILIINGYEKFSKDGFIGDEPIRLHAQALMEQMGDRGSHVILWMNQLAFECFRYFAHQHIRKNDQASEAGRSDT